MKKAIVLVLGGVALYVIIVVVANLHPIAWWHSNQVNAQRLKVLQSDAILHCSIPNINAWREREGECRHAGNYARHRLGRYKPDCRPPHVQVPGHRPQPGDGCSRCLRAVKWLDAEQTTSSNMERYQVIR